VTAPDPLEAEPTCTPTRPRLAYWRIGEAGPPVLLIMGLSMPGRIWRSQVEGLGDTHRLVVYDHRGLGQSEAPREPFDIGDMAGDALRVLDAAGFTQAHVVGVSMGGMIAQHLALRAPERVRSLSLVATHAGGPTAALLEPAALVDFARVIFSPGGRRHEALVRLLYPPEVAAQAEGRVREQLSSPVPPRTRFLQIRAVALHDTRRRVHELAVPTQVLMGDQDRLVRPSATLALHARLPEGTPLHRFPESGHGLIFQDRQQVNARLAEFIAEHD
jgi:3-oxoadipate enol-lactonase